MFKSAGIFFITLLLAALCFTSLNLSADDSIIVDEYYDPVLKIYSEYEVLPKNNNTEVSLETVNIEKLTFQFDRLTSEGSDSQFRMEVPLPEVRNESIVVQPGVRKMLNNRSGVLQINVTSIPETDRSCCNSEIKAQVTPFHVHTKISYFNTLVWVTDIETGEPVSGAVVKIYKNNYSEFINTSQKPNIITRGITDRYGTVILEGSDKITPGLEYPNNKENIMVQVEKGQDMALLPLNYDFRIRYLLEKEQSSFIRTWGTTSQVIYKPGEKIKFKIYVRDQNQHSYIKAPLKGYSLSVIDPERDIVFELDDITLSEFGAFEGEFELPETCRSGWYSFELKTSFTGETYCPLKLFVSDFNKPAVLVEPKIKDKIYKPNDILEIITSARLGCGEAYEGAVAKVSATLGYVYDDWFFRNGTGATYGFTFNNSEQKERLLYHKDGALDKNGNMLSKIKLPENDFYIGAIHIKSTVRYEHRKMRDFSIVKYATRDRFAGIKPDLTSLQKDKSVSMQVIVVDENGKLLSGVPVNIIFEMDDSEKTKEKNQWSSSEYKYNFEVIEERTVYSSEEPLKFHFKVDKDALYRFSASVIDTKGRKQRAEHLLHIKWEVLPEEQESVVDSLDIVPDKARYKVGETARYEIKNPVPGARALVSIERNGILKHWVQKVDKSYPFIEVKIEEDFIPGFYFSAVIMSPGDDPLNESDQENNRAPIVRTGYVPTDVDDIHKKLAVHVSSKKESYKPGDRVKIKVKAVPEKGKGKEPVEIAVFVLNSELLDLLSGVQNFMHPYRRANFFDPHKGFYQLGYLDAGNYNLLKHMMMKAPEMIERLAGPKGIIYGRTVTKYIEPEEDIWILDDSFLYEPDPKTKIEADARNVAWGIEKWIDSGNEDSLEKKAKFRSDKKYICYWNPSIKADKNGKATIEFIAPEDIDEWRIVVMAVTPTDRMGLGEGSFKIVGEKQETEKSK